MKVTALLAAALVALTSFFAAAVQAGDISVTNPWARATVGKARPAAAYLVIENTGGEADRLVGISSAQAGMAHAHKTEMTDGVMKMMPAGDLDVPAGGSVELKPGGLHIMLMKLTGPLLEGESLTLELVFEQAGPMSVTVPILSIGAQGLE